MILVKFFLHLSDKEQLDRFQARVKVVETVNAALEAGMRAHGIDPPPPPG
jgi:hypothetical protein